MSVSVHDFILQFDYSHVCIVISMTILGFCFAAVSQSKCWWRLDALARLVRACELGDQASLRAMSTSFVL